MCLKCDFDFRNMAKVIVTWALRVGHLEYMSYVCYMIHAYKERNLGLHCMAILFLSLISMYGNQFPTRSLL